MGGLFFVPWNGNNPGAPSSTRVFCAAKMGHPTTPYHLFHTSTFASQLSTFARQVRWPVIKADIVFTCVYAVPHHLRT